MRRGLSVFLLCAAAMPLFAAPLFQDPGLYDYLGNMGGKTVIGLPLHQRDGQKLTGSYFYKRYLKDIPLTGEFMGERDLVLREADDKGQTRGTFALHFAERDSGGKRSGDVPLTMDVLTGTWTSPDGAKTFPVYLALTTIVPGASAGKRYTVAGATDDAAVEHKARAFFAAVEKGDRKAVAGLIGYPVAFSLNGKPGRATNEQEFLSNYYRIFTGKFVERIRRAIPHNMFANADGIMIADGAVWFDEKGRVKALNN